MNYDQLWNDELAQLSEPHILQTAEWALLKSKYGWHNITKTWTESNGTMIGKANILIKNITIGPIRFKANIMYIPRGPIFNWQDQNIRQTILSDLLTFAREHQSIFIKIDPEVILGTGIPETDEATENSAGISFKDQIQADGWIYSQDQIQFKNSVWLDIEKSEEQLLANMKSKTRYNIRLSEKKGVHIRQGTPADFEMLANLYAETAIRDGFTIRSKQYYLDVWNIFYSNQKLTPLIAVYENQPIAALMLFHYAKRAWYIHGMSRSIHRNTMAAHLLQWEAIKTAKKLGCIRYDLWGAPFELNETDPMWGVFRFKQGYSGVTVRTLGAWDYPIRPVLYKLYTKVLPVILDKMRTIGNRNTQKTLDQSESMVSQG